MVLAMPSRASRAALLGSLLSLLVAAPALGATIPVAADGVDSQCTRGASQPCKTIVKAESIAEAGDTILVGAGSFIEPAPVVVSVADVTIQGAGQGTVITTNPAESGGPTLTFQQAGKLADALVLKAAGTGAAVAAQSSLDVDRVNLINIVAGAPALSVVSPSSGAGGTNAITIDSAIISAAKDQYGIAVTSPAGLPSTADDVTLALRHVTIAGPDSAKGISLDASTANGFGCPGLCVPGFPADPAANMTATLTDSIVDGQSTTAQNAGGPGVAPNSAKIVFSGKNLADAVTGTTEGTATGPADAATLFWNASKYIFLLRSTASAAVDQGSAAPAAGESATDLYGEPRKNGAATDLGADEYHNLKPVALLKSDKNNPAPGETVTFESASKDPEEGFGGGIVKYYWDFGDGQFAQTTVPKVTHTYAAEGERTARLAVEDAQGAFSDPSNLKFVVSPIPDRAAPVVEILQPKSAQTLRLRGKKPKTKGKKRTPAQLVVLGGVTDPSGIKQVDVALRLVKRKTGKGAGSGRCEFYNGKRSFTKAACDKPVWLKASRTKNVWRFRTVKRWRVPPGTYELRARGLDMVGNLGSAFSADAKTLVKLKIK
jgi:hypothetical protein